MCGMVCSETPQKQKCKGDSACGKGVFGTWAMSEMRVSPGYLQPPEWEAFMCRDRSGELCLELHQGDRDGTAASFKWAGIKKPLDGAVGTPPHLGTVSADPGDLAKADLNHEISPLNNLLIIPHPICLEVSHEFKGHVLEIFFSSVPKTFWRVFFPFFLVLAIVLVLQSLSTPAAPSCAGHSHNSHKLPSAVLLNMTDPSVIAVLQPALVNVLGRMVPMWVRFMFVRAVVSEPESAAFPFSKTQKIYLPNASWVCFSLFFK